MRLAVYTTYCGATERSKFNPVPIDQKYPHYLISNNRNYLDTISSSFGFKPIFLDEPLTDDAIVSAKQSKIPKILPHKFKELSDFDYLLYYDDKLSPNLSTIENLIEAMERYDSPVAVRKHPSIPKPNVLFDFAESMYQWRYRADWESMVEYLTKEISLGYSVKLDDYLATGLILRNMKHRDTAALNELWYDHTMRSSAVCQISFHFARQRFKNIMILPETVLNQQNTK